MNINNTNTNKTAFRALHMPTLKHIERESGVYMAVEALKATPELTEIAKNVDIFIDTKNSTVKTMGFDIEVKQTPKNILQKMFKKMKTTKTEAKLSDIASMHSLTIKEDGEIIPELYNQDKGMAEYLVEKTQEAKDELNKKIFFDNL